MGMDGFGRSDRASPTNTARHWNAPVPMPIPTILHPPLHRLLRVNCGRCEKCECDGGLDRGFHDLNGN
jgi:hypothetical protein